MRRSSNTFLRKTRKGAVLKVLREHYLRDDIWCGSAVCRTCGYEAVGSGSDSNGDGGSGSDGGGGAMDVVGRKRQPVVRLGGSSVLGDALFYVVIDANVALHQMDALEHDGFVGKVDVVVLQTVLQEVRHRNHRVYSRLRKLIARPDSRMFVFSNEHHRSTFVERKPAESPNDRNDRAICVAAKWYETHLGDSDVQVVLLTNDEGNRKRAVQDFRLRAERFDQFVRKHMAKQEPGLVDVLQAVAEGMDAEDDSRFRKERGGMLFAAHASEQALKTGLLSGKFKKGTFRIGRDFWNRGSVRVSGIEAPVEIVGMDNMNRAVDGDVVAIQLLDEKSGDDDDDDDDDAKERKEANDYKNNNKKKNTTKKRQGRVVGIVRRNWRQYCGSLELTDKKRGTVLFISVDRRIPKVRIETRQIEKLMDQRIMVQIDSWPRSSRYPHGHFVRALGPIGDRDTETQVILLEHEVDTSPWSDEVLACLPPDDWRIPDSEVAKRLDLRETRRIFSIDPPGCKDIDDALHVHALPNGNFEVGVHIADVTHYVPCDCPLDLEARKRGTSVYLVERRIDMIPGRLSTDLCSLVGNVDRLAFSVFWEMTPDAEIIDTRFYKTVIRSCAALAYGDAQEALDSDRTDDMAVAIKRMNSLAKKLRAKRQEAGALTLASTEVKFLLDSESQRPTDVEMYKLREANALVEEFMLLANISVAKKTLAHYPTFAMLRRHPAPAASQFEPLVRAAATQGIEIDTSSSRALADSLDRAHVPGHPYFNKLIRVMATRCMTQAVYFSSGEVETPEYRHYGLATPVYTHFTSPIRRYADVVVHRLLAASLNIAPLPKTLEDNSRVSDICEVINHRNRMAQFAGRKSAELYTLVYFRDKVVEEDAVVTSVYEHGISVLVPRYGIESSVKLWERKETETADMEGKDDSPYTFDPEKLELRSPQRSFAIFQQMRVRIFVKESKMRRSWLVVECAELPESDDCKAARAKLRQASEAKSKKKADDAVIKHRNKRRRT